MKTTKNAKKKKKKKKRKKERQILKKYQVKRTKGYQFMRNVTNLRP